MLRKLTSLIGLISKICSHMEFRVQPSQLSAFQRMYEYFLLTQKLGQHMDQVNYDRRIYKNPLSLALIETIFEPEHGYITPDASCEIRSLLLKYEYTRTRPSACRNIYEHNQLDEAAVGIGFGVTGTLFNLLLSICDYSRACNKKSSRDIIVFGPCYPGILSVVARAGLNPKLIMCSEANNFLPSEHEVAIALSSKPLALIISLPSNPTLAYFSDSHRDIYQKLINGCQESQVFLVVDAVYQDCLHEAAEPYLELFSLAQSLDFLVKVSGQSKDRPGMAGMRVGYYLGDPRIESFYRDTSASSTCSPNTPSVCSFAVDILFRLLTRIKAPLSIDTLGLLDDNIAGWDKKIDRKSILLRMKDEDVFAIYRKRCQSNMLYQTLANKSIIRGCGALDNLHIINTQCNGNLLFLKILGASGDLFSCHHAYYYLLETLKLGVLPGNVFGLPIVPGSSFFRITSTHDSHSVIMRNLVRISRAL